jgi:hypothetical protein
MQLKVWIFLVFSAVTCVAYPAIYQWRDANGEMHFSDTYQPGAAIVSTLVPEPPLDRASPMNSGQTSSTTPSSILPTPNLEKPPKATVQYTLLDIISPTEKQTVRDNSGNFDVQVKIEPELQKGDRLQLLVDGKVVATSQDQNNVIPAKGVDRGQHNIQVQVINSTGNILLQSPSHIIYLQKASILPVQASLLEKISVKTKT